MAPTWQRHAPLVLPLASIGFGLILCILSCAYMFRAIGLHTTVAKEDSRICKDNPQKFKGENFFKACRYLRTETAGGLLGLVFGFIQIGIGGGMFLTKEKPELRKVWAVVNIILLLFIVTAGALPLSVYIDYDYCGVRPTLESEKGGSEGESSDGKQFTSQRKECTADINYEKTVRGQYECYRHIGCNQFKTITRAHAVILIFGIIAIFDTIFMIASAVILFMMHGVASDSPGGTNPPGAVAPMEPMPTTESQTESVVDSEAPPKAPSKAPSKKTKRKG